MELQAGRISFHLEVHNCLLYFDVVILDLLDASAYESNLGRNRYEKGTFYLHNQGNGNGQSKVIY